MMLKMAHRMITTVDRKALWKLTYNFGWKGMRSVQKFKRRLKEGVVFPPFLYLSIINSCNLRCTGCWVDVDADESAIPLEDLNKLIDEAKTHGNYFFGILGGEPFMHPQLLELIEAHPDCYFQIFTNGQFINEKVAERLRRAGNATPLISIEGTEFVSDERRGRLNVLNHTLKGLDHSLAAGVPTGVATSVCQTNFDDMINEAWLDNLIERGVHYVWFHGYRPMGPDPAPELALSPEQLLEVRRFIVNMRCRKAIGIIDPYWDHKGRALCPAATGISHHIGPWGDVEPCPIVQFAKEKITDNGGIYKTLTESAFLADFRQAARTSTRGCIVLEEPERLKNLIETHGARDSTARQTAMDELSVMTPRPSQYNREVQVPEKHWMYRFAKKHFYSDFGAYAGLADHD
ncbi:MAG: radical SAM protein [Planctomycetota bacterium]|jgi:MoaA/NifB/PqqE/SkfB family radical SAM enzyme